jgi:dTDP-4-dehydrorhamnose reductase
MKFLVLGCNGMAGHMVSQYLHERGHDVLGLARQKSAYVPCVTGDVRDGAFLRELIGGGFDTVINCVGVLNQFAEQDRERAVYLNAYLPHFLALITGGTPTQVIHLSTDCVFSGRRGRYTEDDLPDGKTFYDRTKALGELEDEKNFTLRSSIVGPDLNPDGIGLLNWFLRQSGAVNGYTGAVWTGQTTLQLAKTIEAAARERAHGLYHMVPADSITKYRLLELFNHYLRVTPLIIHPIVGARADKSLLRTKFDFGCQIPDYETMVKELAAWMRAHKNMYPQYSLQREPCSD